MKIIMTLVTVLSLLLGSTTSSSVTTDSNTIIAASTHTNISYGEFERNTMDIYLPDLSDSNQPLGAIMFIHGGSWTTGDKVSESTLCKQFAAKGYVTASINYHFIDATYPVSTNMTDIELAIKKLKSFCAENGYNVTSLALHGYSSGAHIATLFAYSCPERSAIDLKFVVNMAGPSDFHSDTWHEWDYNKNTGPSLACSLYGYENLTEYAPNGWLDMSLIPSEKLESIINNVSPVYYMNENSIPTICGYAGDGKDGIVPTKNKTIVYDKLKEFNIEHSFFTFDNSNHFLLGNPTVRAELYDTVGEYCKKHFGY